MFTIPNLKEESPSLEENVEALLESISNEDAALAKLVCLEGEKIKRFANGGFDFSFNRTPEEILKFVQSTKRISDLIAQKGLFLNQRLHTIFLLENKIIQDFTKDEAVKNYFNEFQTSINEFLISIETLMETVKKHRKFFSDSFLSMSCRLLEHIHRQMMFLSDKGTEHPKKPSVIYPAPPPYPPPWKP